MKKYIIFDLDGTLIQSESENLPLQFEKLKEYLPDLEYDYFRYYCMQTAGTPLFDQLKVLFKNTLDDENLHKITDEVYDIILKNAENNPFFEWITDMIQSLQTEYTLFLSTGNSDEFAQKKLSEAGIEVCFQRIMGSSIIWKWPEHIKTFKEISWNKDFEKYCIYIWDGNTDRDIATMHNIDFIKVWKAWIDTYEVDKTIESLDIIKSL